MVHVDQDDFSVIVMNIHIAYGCSFSWVCYILAISSMLYSCIQVILPSFVLFKPGLNQAFTCRPLPIEFSVMALNAIVSF